MGIPPRILTVNRIPYRIWFATSHQEVETKISFPLFRGNGSWCRISRIQSSSHHIISELKSSPPQAISASLLYPVGRGWRMGKHGRDHRRSLGPSPRRKRPGRYSNAEDHGSSLRTQSTPPNTKYSPFGGTCSGIWGSSGRNALNRAKNYCCHWSRGGQSC